MEDAEVAHLAQQIALYGAVGLLRLVRLDTSNKMHIGRRQLLNQIINLHTKLLQQRSSRLLRTIFTTFQHFNVINYLDHLIIHLI